MGMRLCISNKLPGGGDAERLWHFIYSYLVARVTFHPVTAIYKSILSALRGTKLLGCDCLGECIMVNCLGLATRRPGT